MDNSKNQNGDVWDIAAIIWCVFITLVLEAVLEPSLGEASMLVATTAQLVLGVAYLRMRELKVAEFLRWNRFEARHFPIVALIGLAGAIGFDSLDRIVNHFFPMPDDQMTQMLESFKFTSPGQGLLLIFTVTLLGPLVEESLFRGAIQLIFERKSGITKGVLWTAILFALIHLQPWWMIQLLIFGVVLGYLAWQFDSIIPAAIVHGVNNLWSLLLLQPQAANWTGGYFLNGFVHPIWTAIAIFGLVYGIIRISKG